MSGLEKLQQWLLYTPNGRYTLRNERLFYHNSVQNVFGYYSLQIGLPEINFLQGNKIPTHFVLGHDVLCDLKFLPFANNSIDLIVCPHVLEFTSNYNHFLQECYRVLIPRGKLIISSFSQDSFFCNWNQKSYGFKINPINLETLKNQLSELNFNIDGGKFYGYRPPINNAKILSRLGWMDKAGDRWFPTYANNFGLTATKDVITPTPITPFTPTYAPGLTPNLGTAKICKK